MAASTADTCQFPMCLDNGPCERDCPGTKPAVSAAPHDPEMTDAERSAFLAPLYDEWVQVGWMPDDTLQDTYGIGPLNDGYLFTIEQAEHDGGIKPEYADHMIPVYARRHHDR